MTAHRTIVDDVRWRYVLPWMILLDGPAAAASLGCVALSGLGLLLAAGGLRGLRWLFQGTGFLEPAFGAAALPAKPESLQWAWGQPWRLLESLLEPWRALAAPDAGLGEYALAIAGALWLALVWAWVGGAVLRIAVEGLARKQRLSLFAAWRHGRQRWGPRLAAPLLPLSLGGFLFACLALLNSPARWPAATAAVWVGSLLFVPLLLAAAVLILGAVLALPLMWTALAVEKECDAFDAFSLGFAYTLQRPLQYLLYGFLATVLGWIAWGVVAAGAWCSEEIFLAAVRWGAGAEGAQALLAAGGPAHFWRTAIWLGVGAYGYSYFWHAAAAVYLLLRADLDGQEISEVSLGDDHARRLPLPPVAPLDASSEKLD